MVFHVCSLEMLIRLALLQGRRDDDIIGNCLPDSASVNLEPHSVIVEPVTMPLERNITEPLSELEIEDLCSDIINPELKYVHI